MELFCWWFTRLGKEVLVVLDALAVEVAERNEGA
jgi:hypothetical protein